MTITDSLPRFLLALLSAIFFPQREAKVRAARRAAEERRALAAMLTKSNAWHPDPRR